MCSDAWKALYAGALKDRRITRVIGTHLHPDHIGLAGWIAKKQDVKLWMTRGEMLTARAIVADSADTAPDEVIVQSRAAGWDEAAIEAQRTRGWNMFQRMIRSEEHTSELQSLMRISYAVLCLKKKRKQHIQRH